MTQTSALRVRIQGAGKVGRCLYQGLKAQGWTVRLRAQHLGWPKAIAEDVLILALRDSQLPEAAKELAARKLLTPRTVVLHLAGALEPSVLGALQEQCAGIGQMHPMLSFAHERIWPPLSVGQVLVAGDKKAVLRAKKLCKALQMKAHQIEPLDRRAYHAAAALLAGGTIAVLAASRELLCGAGVKSEVAEAMLGGLLQSVAFNARNIGLPGALTGIVRRGDVRTFQRHLEAVVQCAPQHLALYLACARAQLPLARALAEATPGGLETIEKLIQSTQDRDETTL